jgi:hypothetical protein
MEVCRKCFVLSEVSVSGRSLIQISPTECGVSECDRVSSIMRRLWSTRGCYIMEKEMREKISAYGVFVLTLEEMRQIGISKRMC